MKKFSILLLIIIFIIVVCFFIIGDYVYRTGTKVSCNVHSYHIVNSPHEFFTPDIGNGPFKGKGWNKWVNFDLSSWWLKKDITFEKIKIEENNSSIELIGWWIPATYPEKKQTVIVVHGINTNRQDFNVLMPATFLANNGFNVLLFDLRDHGESTCEDGRHSAGQLEALDILSAVNWLKTNKGISQKNIGIHGISGGAIATLVVTAKNSQIAAFSLESPIFDFNKAAEDEVKWQGFPGFLWTAAYYAARIRGVNLVEVSSADGINNLKGRPMQVFHGTQDSRVNYQNSLDLVKYAKSKGLNIKLHSFKNADHTEALLTETERYASELTQFFNVLYK